MKKLLLALLLLPSLAFAQFTTQEIEEVKKIVRARNEFNATFVKTADSIRDFGNEGNRQQYVAVLAAGIDALLDCHDAMKYLFNSTPSNWRPGKLIFVPRLPNLPRADIVAQARTFVASCDQKATTWGNLAVSLANQVGDPVLASSASRLLTNAVNLETWNNTLAFASPLPPPPTVPPRIVGTHGDIDEARFATETADLKFIEVYADLTSFYKFVDVYPDSAILGLREALRYMSPAINFVGNVWAMNFGVVTNFNDQNAINIDEAAGSGLRGTDFFRLLRQVETLSASEKMKPNFAGRTLTGGATGNLQVGMGPFADAIGEATAVNTGTESASWWLTFTGRDARAILGASNGMLEDWMKDMSVGWEAMDHVLAAYLMFFHEIPAPPNPPPSNGFTCDTPGVHVEGTACVADPPSPCPMFDAEMVLVDQTHAEARCVAVP